MTYPVVPINRSAVLAGVTNGRIPDALLVDTPGQAGGPTVRLIAPAAATWAAMCAAALKAGITLKASGPFDSYRPYEVQEKIFRQRYTTTPIPGRPTRKWNGQTWWQKPGTAAAAVPGTSNHGWAGAVDTGVETDGDPGTESIDRRAIDWLLDHAYEFGWSWELQSEPWHLHYFAGDINPPPRPGPRAVTAVSAQGGRMFGHAINPVNGDHVEAWVAPDRSVWFRTGSDLLNCAAATGQKIGGLATSVVPYFIDDGAGPRLVVQVSGVDGQLWYSVLEPGGWSPWAPSANVSLLPATG